jgi:hypothetical protein
MSKPTIAAMLPETDAGTQRVQGRQGVPEAVAVLESVRRRIGAAKAANDRHGAAAPVFALALDGLGKDIVAEEILDETRQHISDMRNGKRGAAVWQLVAILMESREAFESFVRPFCEQHALSPPQPKKQVTREQVLEAALAYLLDSPPLLKSFSREAGEHLGVEPGDVLQALK